MENIPQAGFAGVVLLVNAFMQLLKRVDTKKWAGNFYSVIAEAVGFGLGLAVGLDWFSALFVGLSAMGLYGGVRHTVNSFGNNK